MSYFQDLMPGNHCFGCGSDNLQLKSAWRDDGRDIGSGEPIWYVTGSMQVSYLKPTPISKTLHPVAEVGKTNSRKMRVFSEVFAEGALVAKGEVLAVRVDAGW